MQNDGRGHECKTCAYRDKSNLHLYVVVVVVVHGERGRGIPTYQSAPESARAGLAVLAAAAEAKEVGAIAWWCECGVRL